MGRGKRIMCGGLGAGPSPVRARVVCLITRAVLIQTQFVLPARLEEVKSAQN